MVRKAESFQEKKSGDLQRGKEKTYGSFCQCLKSSRDTEVGTGSFSLEVLGTFSAQHKEKKNI